MNQSQLYLHPCMKLFYVTIKFAPVKLLFVIFIIYFVLVCLPTGILVNYQIIV